jgi:O-antigen ligase
VWIRGHLAAVAAGTVATAGWILDSTVSHHGVDSWRLPATWICATAGYGCARGLPHRARGALLVTVSVAGGALAAAGLTLVGVRSTFWTLVDERSLRYAGPLTYPSAVGLFLVISLVATAEAWPSRRRPDLIWTTIVRAVIVLGVIATDSRGAVLGLVVALCFRRLRQPLGPAAIAAVVAGPLLLLGQRTDGERLLATATAAAVAVAIAVSIVLVVATGVARRVVTVAAAPAIVVIGWLLLTQHHVVSGLDASWTERGNILRGAASLFARHPWFGAGPDPRIPAHTLAGQPGVAFFAHNEPVEILVSIGVIGTLLLAGCVTVVVRALYDHRSVLATPLAISAASAGLVDFVWHFPALGLAIGIVAGASMRRNSQVRLGP